MPEARFNDGGMLPPMSTAGYGNGLDGSADGRFNAGSSLLSNMEPYAYGKGDRLSTQTAYLANPHNIQKIVPQLMLPDCIQANSAQTFMLAHGVSDGDIAFSIRFSTPAVRTQLMHHSVNDYFRQGAGRAVDYICNMAVINYIIRGFCTPHTKTNGAWVHFASAIGFEDGYYLIQGLLVFRDETSSLLETVKTHDDDTVDEYDFRNFQNMFEELRDQCPALLRHKPAWSKTFAEGEMQPLRQILPLFLESIEMSFADIAQELIRDHFRPLGVVIGSDKQGGQHELNNASVTFPVSYVVTISIDGKNENICNYWRHTHISSGSLLGFKVAMRHADAYTLNNHKFLVRKTFGESTKLKIPQIVPSVVNEVTKKHSDKVLFQRVGFWQFCMSQIMHQALLNEAPCTSVVPFHAGAVLQVTISVAWMRSQPRKRDEPPQLADAEEAEIEPDENENSQFHGIPFGVRSNAQMQYKMQSKKQSTVQTQKVTFSKQPLYAMKIKPIEEPHKRGRDSTHGLGDTTSGAREVNILGPGIKVRRVIAMDAVCHLPDVSTAVRIAKAHQATTVLTTPVPNNLVLTSSIPTTPVLTTPVLTTPVLTTPVLTTPVPTSAIPTTPVLTTPVLTTPMPTSKSASKSRAKTVTDKKLASVSEGSFTRL
ncbi:hypothetical protein T484DRAFT_1756514 [Baffinella frigidus]|nr:hypothetical protein T484DRAFT_1756514 [Cryptophyta sp. CCMP2293]